MYFTWNPDLAVSLVSAIWRGAYDGRGFSDLYDRLDASAGPLTRRIREGSAERQRPVARKAWLMAMSAMPRIRSGEIKELYFSKPGNRHRNPDDIDLGEVHDGYHLMGSTVENPAFDRNFPVIMIPSGLSAAVSETEPAAPEDANNGLVFERDGNLLIVRLDEERLSALPASARPFAARIGVVQTGQAAPGTLKINEDLTFSYIPATTNADGATIEGGIPTADQLATDARTAYRSWLRVTLNRPNYDPTEQARKEEARKKAAERFAAFAKRTPDTVKHVPTLPFVPHGLSSSRRWGIEVESGGARGVKAPELWNRIGDGSLRSAWDGYKEVQDFEPFDEEVERYRPRVECYRNGVRIHDIELVQYDYQTGTNIYEPNPDYVNPENCENCGPITETVHRVPQTIIHQSQGDDCAEFVSPILVSMHSKGLETILEQLNKQPQNSSAGVHVHVEADDLTDAQVATLIFGYDILEPILEASYQREARRYCQRRSSESVLETARKLRPGQKITQSDVRGGDRYVTLNTTALNDHGTIEFRAMGPVYDYGYLVRWAMLCRELVNLVAAGVTTKQFSRVKSWNDLTMLLAEHGKEYIRAVVYEASGETGEAPDLVKRGQEITQEAMDNDLNNLLTAGTAMHNSISANWAPLIAQMQSFGRAAEQLVAVGNVRQSNTWTR